MHDGSWLLGHVRYPCTKAMLYIQCDAMQCNLSEMEKEGKPHGEKPPPKKRDKYNKEEKSHVTPPSEKSCTPRDLANEDT